jgi:NADPH:quinone reductase-like Zn-dependent oxidoreductase
MKAVGRDAYGSADLVGFRDIERPAVAPGEVLVRVRAAGLDRGVWHMMTGRPYLLRAAGFGLRRPKTGTLGSDLAGVVETAGAEVTGLAPGDAVFGGGTGSFAEYAVARPGGLARMPANLTYEQAAAVPVSGVTALQALRDRGRLQAGQQVLIIGASGGVGSFAVQLATAFGAHVTGVCSTANLDLVRSLGADRVIDYTQDDWAGGAHRYDLILDIAGNPAPTRLRRALTPTGTAVLVGGEEGGSLTGGMDRQLRALALSVFVRQRLTGMLCQERAADLERLTELIESGRLTPRVDRSYPLDRLPEAMRHLVAGRAGGKVAIAVRS